MDHAGYYLVFRNTQNDSSSANEICSWQSDNSYEDTSISQGQIYYYWVKASVDNWGENTSDFSESDSGSTKISSEPELSAST